MDRLTFTSTFALCFALIFLIPPDFSILSQHTFLALAAHRFGVVGGPRAVDTCWLHIPLLCPIVLPYIFFAYLVAAVGGAVASSLCVLDIRHPAGVRRREGRREIRAFFFEFASLLVAARPVARGPAINTILSFHFKPSNMPCTPVINVPVSALPNPQ